MHEVAVNVPQRAHLPAQSEYAEMGVVAMLVSLACSTKNVILDPPTLTYFQSATRTLAKQLVQLRGQKDQLYAARARIAGVGNQAAAAATTVKQSTPRREIFATQ